MSKRKFPPPDPCIDPSLLLPESERSPFVVIEGPDGTGKSTQARMLADAFGGTVTVEPQANRAGRLIRSHLRGDVEFHPWALAHLFAADRVEHLSTFVVPFLNHTARYEGSPRMLVGDRYVQSSLVYQGMQIHVSGDLPVKAISRIWELNTAHGMLVRPHLSVYLRADLGARLDRLRGRNAAHRDRFEHDWELEEVAQMYEHVAQFLSSRGWPTLYIDADRSVDDIHDDIRMRVWQELRHQHRIDLPYPKLTDKSADEIAGKPGDE